MQGFLFTSTLDRNASLVLLSPLGNLIFMNNYVGIKEKNHTKAQSSVGSTGVSICKSAWFEMETYHLEVKGTLHALSRD